LLEAAGAVAAAPTSDLVVDTDAISSRQIGDCTSGCGDGSRNLVPEGQREGADPRESRPIVKIGSADSGRGYLDYDIVR
jgi:hypothetical protein